MWVGVVGWALRTPLRAAVRLARRGWRRRLQWPPRFTSRARKGRPWQAARRGGARLSCRAAWRPSIQSRGAAVRAPGGAYWRAAGCWRWLRITWCSQSSSANSRSGPGLSQQGVAGRTNGASVGAHAAARDAAGRRAPARAGRAVPCALRHAGGGLSVLWLLLPAGGDGPPALTPRSVGAHVARRAARIESVPL